MRFLIAGLGSIGRRHFRNLRALGEEDILLLRSKMTAESEAELAGYATFTNIAEALKEKPDAVLICNPTALHLTVAVPAAKAGCSLMIEKPLATSFRELQPLLQITEKQKLKVLSAFQFRFHPGIKKIKELLDSGTIGKILRVECSWGEYLPAWHPWEDYRNGYSARADLGGGVVRTLCHPFDYLRWLLGEPISVSARIAKRSNLEIDVEDEADIFLELEDDGLVDVHLDYYRQPAKHSFEICGTKGVILWDNTDGAVRVSFPNQPSDVFAAPAGFERNTMFLDEMRHFLAVLRDEEELICSLEDGIKAQIIIDAVYESNKSQATIELSRFQAS